MSTDRDEDDSQNEDEDELQFDNAEYDVDAQEAQRQITCRGCSEVIEEYYFTVKGVVVCGDCHHQVVAAESTPGPHRFWRALAYGSAWAAVGSLIYYAVLALTGYEIGLIAIAVGFMVGLGVKNGSGGRGGWVYQTLAIVLTYSAIVVTYIPLILNELEQQAIVAQPTPTQAPNTLPGPATEPSPAGEPGATTPSITPSATPPAAAPPPPTLAEFVIAWIFIIGLAIALPFLAGLENIIGLLIIGFALYEAWKINKRVPLQASGPHRVDEAEAELFDDAAT